MLLAQVAGYTAALHGSFAPTTAQVAQNVTLRDNIIMIMAMALPLSFTHDHEIQIT